MNSSGENWYVKLANGDVHNVTVDQLDWAFEQGHIDANTLVLADEAQGWVRLGEVAGLDEAPAPAAAPARAPVPVAAPVRAVAPAPAVAPTPTPMVAAYTPAPRPAAPNGAAAKPSGREPWSDRYWCAGWLRPVRRRVAARPALPARCAPHKSDIRRAVRTR